MGLLKSINKQFKKPAGFGGRVISKIMEKGNSGAYNKLITLMQVNPGDTIFEIGYGPGLGIEKILSKTDCSYTGIDFSELMYKRALKRYKNLIDNKKVNLFFGNFIYFKNNLGKFDKIYCINVIYFWDELFEPFSKVKSMINTGGSFYIFMAHFKNQKNTKYFLDEIFNKYTIEQVEHSLYSAGFSNVEYTYEHAYFIKASV